MKMENAKEIMTNLAFDASRVNNQEFKALQKGVQAISMVTKIQEIIQKRDNAFDGQEFGASYGDLDNIIEEIREVVFSNRNISIEVNDICRSTDTNYQYYEVISIEDNNAMCVGLIDNCSYTIPLDELVFVRKKKENE